MNLQEQHWQNLFGNLTTEGNPWYGIWNVYSPEKEKLKSSQGIRTLKANEDKTIITHTNQFPSREGDTQQKQWQIEKVTCNQPDGLLHPADPSKRALSLTGYGSSTWLSKSFKPGNSFAVELFLKYEDFNHSIGSIYGKEGNLEKILHLREQFGKFPPEAKPEIETVSGDWQGTREWITPNLQKSSIEKVEKLVLDPTVGKNKTFFLPDAVVVTIPQKLVIGEEFEIIAGIFVSNNQYKRLRAQYDISGNFIKLVSEVFNRQN